MQSCKFTLPTIEFVGGASQPLSFRMRTADGKSGFNLSGCFANFSVINCVHKGGKPVISKWMTVSMSPASSTYDMLSVTLDPLDTVDLFGKFIYQITIGNGAGETELPKQGELYITRNINPDFIKSEDIGSAPEPVQPSNSISATDDGNGNVTIILTGASAVDDGNGNIVII